MRKRWIIKERLVASLRRWFLSGLLLVFISLVIAWMTRMPEILVFFNLIVGMISLTIALYIHIGLRWFYIYNELRTNHEGAEYHKKNRLKYKMIIFGLPNVGFGGIVNEIFEIWPWT
ncbi:hypothetical protein MH117_03885 [Paenibacillus sp. ACRRX]|uniref:hypothetical protein n=1 Tax=Paenibacillus sp. ACRRX TaxID=2918206 RepID=UPI001EF6D65E|nr:hypothetical protein [Paenibacillus sp. ACRRX]MCG7406546.1 hypothetical protein [Paenibacillus sp. ACRRX]